MLRVPRSAFTGVGGFTLLLFLSGVPFLQPAAEGQSADVDPSAPPGKPRTGADILDKSIAIYVGRELTDDGAVFLGGFGHEPSSHWLEVTPSRTFPEGTQLEVGVTAEARYPGERIRIPQVGETARFITSNYSEFAGFPAPLTNGGLNEHHVAARAVWSPSRTELVAMTPEPQRGISYSDLARAVMERATSARHAVEVAGELIDEFGYAHYGGGSHLFADSEEGWVLLTFAGGQGLWAAERLGPEDVRVLYPGYIRDFPLDFESRPGYVASANLLDFAVEHSWFDPDSGAPFNLQEVYGTPFPGPPGADEEAPYRHPPSLEGEIREMAPVTLPDMLSLVRDPRWSDDRAGYGHVAHLRGGVPSDLGVLWVSVAAAVSTPMVPIALGTRDVPPEYKQHRYLTRDASSTFLNPEFASLEGTRSAYRTFKRLFHHTCSDPERFLRPVTAELEGAEARWADQMRELESRAASSLAEGDLEEAGRVLTERADAWLLEALDLGERLVQVVEERVREESSLQMPDRPVPEGASWQPESGAMSLPPEAVGPRDRQNCYVPGFERYPRAHGVYRDRIGDLIEPTSSAPERE